MGLRGLGASVLALGAVAGCGGSGGATATGSPSSTPTTASAGYDSAQLKRALLTEPPGYRRAAEPEVGRYGTLPSVLSSNGIRQAVELDKPRCATAARAVTDDASVRDAPAALVTFAKGDDRTATETLMAVGPAIAEKQVEVRVPTDCRTFRARVDGQWSTSHVVEAGSTGIGEGSRMVGVATTTAGTKVKTWFVVLRSRGYLATISVYGSGFTRNAAERLARRAYRRAERVLP